MKKSLLTLLLAVVLVTPVFALPPKPVKKNIKQIPKQVVTKDMNLKQQPMEPGREINTEPKPFIGSDLQQHNPNKDLEEN